MTFVSGTRGAAGAVGDSYPIPAGAVHDVRTTVGAGKVVAAYMISKGQPLVSAAK